MRVNEVSQSELEELRFGFYLDLRRRRMRVKEATRLHYHSAVRLVRKYALSQHVPFVRALDALHLASAFATDLSALHAALATVHRTLAGGCRLNKRKKVPSTFQLLLAVTEEKFA